MAILSGVLRNAQCLLGIRGKPMTWLQIAIAAFVLMGLSGCASFDGQQKRVISVKQANAMIASYRPDAAIELIGKIDPLDTAGRNTYRNRLVAAYLTAMDARYSVFVRDISRSGKGMHLTFDTLTLGLTGAGAIFNKAASGLAAGATAAAGLRGSCRISAILSSFMTVMKPWVAAQVQTQLLAGPFFHSTSCSNRALLLA